MNEKFRKILLIIFAALITLALGELLLQITYKLKIGQWVWQGNAFKVDYIIPTDDRRGYTLRPDFYDQVRNMPINERGERETIQPISIDESDGIIVCLGDSVTFGAGVGNDATYPFHLAQTLSTDGYEYYVINAGIPSYNMQQSFARLEIDVFEHVDPGKIEIVTIQVANDISLSTYYRENWNPDLTWADVRFNISPVPFSNYSAISYYLSQALAFPKGDSEDYHSEIMMDGVRNILVEGIEKIKQENDKTAVILLPINPFYYQLDGSGKNEDLAQWEQQTTFIERWDQIIRDFNHMLEEVSREINNVYFLDVRVAMDKMDRNNLFIDYMHLTNEGSIVQADLVKEFLIANELID